MAYVFRLQNEGSNTLEGWQPTQKYNNNEIDSIVDPTGGSAKKPITSIPSPFARMNLVKTAFNVVAQKDENGRYTNIVGNTIYHKIVSDSLDVAQIFFDYDLRFKGKVDIIAWDCKTDLDKLTNSNNPEHKQLGDTLKLFMEQDAKANNFKVLKGIYLLRYKNADNPFEIIGATCPTTLFMCSANDFSKYSKDLAFDKDFPFDNAYNPLHQRDLEFHKYIYAQSLSIPGFSKLFPELYDYIQGSFQMSEVQRRDELRQVTGDMTQYADIPAGGNLNNPVEVLGFPMKMQKAASLNVAQNSGFLIDSSIYQGNDIPLVLPHGKYSQERYYVTGPWDSNTIVPYVVPSNQQSLEARILPQDGRQYPYLTISDFLEDNIIHTENDMKEKNKRAFFDGNVSLLANQSQGGSYLLPLKDKFFEYFTKEELIQGKNGRSMIEMKESVGGLEVTLRIPIKYSDGHGRDFIEYRRVYYNTKDDADVTKNEGSIKERNIAFGMTPNVDVQNSDLSYFRLALMSEFKDICRYTMQCKYNNANIETHSYVRNENGDSYPRCLAVAINKSRLDYVRVACENDINVTGIIIPILKREVPNNQFNFAVDFGTTNTHIEYSIGEQGAINPMEIAERDIQIQYLADYSQKFIDVFDSEFIPELIGQGVNKNGKPIRDHFPMRTALSHALNINWNTSVMPMIEAGVAFTYEKIQDYEYNKVVTNLKWSNETTNEKQVRNYIESLMLMMRNKVLLGNGDLTKTKIIWSYPSSMSPNRVSKLNNIWTETYANYFGGDPDTNIKKITESWAPYFYFNKANADVSNVVTVDVGGGTTDVLVYENQKVKATTSFKCAANALFGNGFSGADGKLNGIIQVYKEQLRTILEHNGESELLSVLNQLENGNRSEDIASFLFALCNNVNNKNISRNVDLNDMLQRDEQFKICFLIFYSSIIYHIAKLMKSMNLQMPRCIAFSGNGSKVVPILTTDKDILQQYTTKMIEKIYGENYTDNTLKIIFKQAQPKEATCKGSIIAANKNSIPSTGEAKASLVAINASDMSSLMQDVIVKNLIDDREYQNNCVNQIKNFIDLTFEINKDFSFEDNFGIESSRLEGWKQLSKQNLDIYISKGLDEMKQNNGIDQSVNESLFFYPIVGILYSLADNCAND